MYSTPSNNSANSINSRSSTPNVNEGNVKGVKSYESISGTNPSNSSWVKNTNRDNSAIYTTPDNPSVKVVVDNKGVSAENALARVLPTDTNTLDFAKVGSDSYEENQLKRDTENKKLDKTLANITNNPPISPIAELNKIKEGLNSVRTKEAERRKQLEVAKAAKAKAAEAEANAKAAEAEAKAKAEREAAEAEAKAKAEREAAEAEASAKAEREAAEAEANARAAEAEANAKAEREAAEAEAKAKAEREAAEAEANAKAEREAAEAEAKAKVERDAAEAATDKVTIYKSTFSIVNDELIFLSENPISIEEIQEEDIQKIIQNSYTTEYSGQKTCILLEAFSGENYNKPIPNFTDTSLHQPFHTLRINFFV